MALDPRQKPILRKEDLRGNYVAVRCPNGCGRILFETSARRLMESNFETRCLQCEQLIVPAELCQTEGESDIVALIYYCSQCGAAYKREVEGIREKCRKCHAYQNIFPFRALGIPTPICDKNAVA